MVTAGFQPDITSKFQATGRGIKTEVFPIEPSGVLCASGTTRKNEGWGWGWGHCKRARDSETANKEGKPDKKGPIAKKRGSCDRK